MRRRLGGWTMVVSAVALLGAAALLTAADVIDRIAAVVNDDIILASEVEEKMFILDSQGQLAGRDSTELAEVRREVLDRLIEEKLVVQRARSQGITADENEVTERVDEAMKQVKSQFPTDGAFQDALAREGISETMLRERYENDVRQEVLAQRVVGREIRSEVEVTTDEVQKYFDEHKDELPQRPDEVQLAHIVIYPVDPAKDRAALDKIEEARKRLMAGESFEKVAADVSDDPSRSRGGELGWFESGDLDPDFQAVVDTLALNTVSAPVHTRFGYHLIEVLERDGTRFHVRHILALVQPSQGDLERAEQKASEARERVMGGESFEQVASEMSDDPLTRNKGGELGWTPMQALLPAVAEMIDSVGVNNISPVVPSDRGFHVFKILNRRGGGAYDFDEIRDQLRGYLEQQELEQAYDKWMAGVRDSAYVEIKNW